MLMPSSACRGLLRSALVSGARSRATVAATAEAASGAAEASAEWQRARSFEEVPGPKPLPLIGNAWRFMPLLGEFSNMDFTEVLPLLRKRYGNIIKFAGIPGKASMVYVFDAQDIEKLYRNEGPRPVRDTIQSLKHYREVLRRDRFGGVQGLGFSQGEEWYNFRRKVNPTMMQPRSTKLYVPALDEVAQNFIQRMLEIRDENLKMPSDFLNELNKWALESISLVALDTRIGCLNGNLSPDSEPQRLIEAAHTMFDSLYRLDVLPSPWRYISTPAWRRLVKSQDYFYDVAMQHIGEAMERIKARGPESVAQGELSVLEKLLISNDDPQVACVMALDMMIAGIDTTAYATGTTLYLLSKNPVVQEKLFQELKTQLPESASQPLTTEKLENCKYLKACVKESMRMRPVAIGGGRRVVVDNLVLSNYRIPKGVDILTGNVVLTNSEEHFERPKEFLPDRWLKDTEGSSGSQSAHPFAFLPFGFGPRTCIGRRFAELEIHTLVARIVRRFRLEFEGEAQFKTTVLQRVESPLTLKVIDRQD